MSENWKKERRSVRKKGLENRITRLCSNAEKSEEIIRNLESRDVVVFGKNEGRKKVNGTTLRTKGISMHTPGGSIEADVGVHMSDHRADMVSVDVTVLDVRKWFSDESYEKEEFSFLLDNLNALDDAIALFRGVYLLLRQHKREIEKANDTTGGFLE